MSDSREGVGAGGLPEGLKFNEQGLIPAVVQDVGNGDVLMVGWMNAESLRRTLEGGRTCFWSRSRQQYWVKGLTSGHVQHVKSVYVDCDQDVLLVKVEQVGAACHEGYRSCFYRQVVGDSLESATLRVIAERIAEPS